MRKRCAPTRQTSLHSSVDTPLAYPPGGRIPQSGIRHAPFQRHQSTPPPSLVAYSVSFAHPHISRASVMCEPHLVVSLSSPVLGSSSCSSSLASFTSYLWSTALAASFTKASFAGYSSPRPFFSSAPCEYMAPRRAWEVPLVCTSASLALAGCC